MIATDSDDDDDLSYHASTNTTKRDIRLPNVSADKYNKYNNNKSIPQNHKNIM
eukprot:UN05127